MKMIDVLNLMAEGKIEEGTKLIIYDIFGNLEYKYRKIYRSFVDEDINRLDEQFNIDEKFLNRIVRLEQPSEQKYRIKIPHSSFYLGFERKENGEKDFMPYIKDLLELERSAEMIFKGVTEKDLKFRTQFTKQDFEKIKELKPYEQFKELVKDDENE